MLKGDKCFGRCLVRLVCEEGGRKSQRHLMFLSCDVLDAK